MTHLTIGFHFCDYYHQVEFNRLKKNANNYEIVKENLTELELILDSCEQPGERPG